MTLQTNLQSLISAVATDIKSLTTKQGNLANLTTTEKTNLVGALNELKTAISSVDLTALLADTTASATNKTWSIDKIKSEISASINALVNGAPAALDTLKELADLLSSNDSAINSLVTSVSNRVRFDAAQTLTTEQQAQACTNIGIGNPETDLAAAYAAAKA
jgi:hypothetical protein